MWNRPGGCVKIHSHERARVAHPRSGADATFGGFRGQQAGAVGFGRQGYVAGTPPQVDIWPWLLPLAPGLKCLSSGASREAITASYGLPPLVSIPRDSPSWVSRPKRRCSLAPDRGCAPHARLCPWMFTQEGRHHRGTRAEVGRGM